MGAARPWRRTPWSADRPSGGAERGCRAVETTPTGGSGRSRGADDGSPGLSSPLRTGSAPDRSRGAVPAADWRGRSGCRAARDPAPGGARATSRGRPARAAARPSVPASCRGRTLTNPPAPGCRRTRRFDAHTSTGAAHERSKARPRGGCGPAGAAEGADQRPGATAAGRKDGAGGLQSL